MKSTWRQVNKEKQKPSCSSHTDCELYIKHRIKIQIIGITIMDSPACIVYNLIKWSQMFVIAIENAMKNTLQLAQIKDIKRQFLSYWCEVAEVGDWEESCDDAWVEQENGNLPYYFFIDARQQCFESNIIWPHKYGRTWSGAGLMACSHLFVVFFGIKHRK